MDATGPMETRLLALERRLVHIDDQLRQQQRQLIGVGQSLWDAWGDRRIPRTPTPTPTPTYPGTTYSGTLKGCNSLGISGATVTIKDHATGTVLGTATTTSGGGFSGTVTLTSNPQSVDITTAESRFNASSTTQSWTGGGSNAVGTVTLTAATGYHCLAGCARPLPGTLTFTHSIYGAFTSTFSSTKWVVSTTVNYPGGGGTGCSAQANEPVTWTLTTAAVFTEQYNCTGLPGGCPNPLFGTQCSSTVSLTSSACPPSFSRVYSLTSLFNPGGGTMTITE
jgi:hypothetical protein